LRTGTGASGAPDLAWRPPPGARTARCRSCSPPSSCTSKRLAFLKRPELHRSLRLVSWQVELDQEGAFDNLKTCLTCIRQDPHRLAPVPGALGRCTPPARRIVRLPQHPGCAPRGPMYNSAFTGRGLHTTRTLKLQVLGGTALGANKGCRLGEQSDTMGGVARTQIRVVHGESRNVARPQARRGRAAHAGARAHNVLQSRAERRRLERRAEEGRPARRTALQRCVQLAVRSSISGGVQDGSLGAPTLQGKKVGHVGREGGRPAECGPRLGWQSSPPPVAQVVWPAGACRLVPSS
jgi:hypothetical protein